mmetsp:Transcript_83380/g.236302  ORF Transcript_83380/g.236302 Transcript_83380/m.236302 type:complete len:230 (-) Transcript_83380:3-692(-)
MQHWMPRSRKRATARSPVPPAPLRLQHWRPRHPSPWPPPRQRPRSHPQRRHLQSPPLQPRPRSSAPRQRARNVPPLWHPRRRPLRRLQPRSSQLVRRTRRLRSLQPRMRLRCRRRPWQTPPPPPRPRARRCGSGKHACATACGLATTQLLAAGQCPCCCSEPAQPRPQGPCWSPGARTALLSLAMRAAACLSDQARPRAGRAAFFMQRTSIRCRARLKSCARETLVMTF